MVIKINTTQAGIPVEIGELKFTFDTSDDALMKLTSVVHTISDDFSNIEGENLEAAKEALKKGYDLLLGEGTFEQVYAQSGSTMQCISILERLCLSLTNELKRMGSPTTQQAKAEQYLARKKAKKQKKSKK